MLMPFFERDGLAFHYRDRGEGVPFVFQHGLGGDVGQPFGLFSPPPGYRLIALDCRGHGETRPLGPPDKIGLAAFADDVCALLDELALPQVVLGGISMGAAVALNLALRFPERVCGLVLSRPAWLDRPMPHNSAVFPLIAQLIRRHGAAHGLEVFKQSEQYAEVLRESPDAARSLCGQFEHPRAEETVVKLERIPHDTPSDDRRAWASIEVPALVMSNRQDPIHPFEYGQIIAAALPQAEFRELTPKSISVERHGQENQAFIEAFLKQYVPAYGALR
jgi:pimeloyl-ACP methyl ester carboxylesterase